MGYGYETCPQSLTNTIRHTLVNTHTHTEFKNRKYTINTLFHELHSLIQNDRFILLYKHFHIVPPIIGLLCVQVFIYRVKGLIS
jgi:hypothetical protein